MSYIAQYLNCPLMYMHAIIIDMQELHMPYNNTVPAETDYERDGRNDRWTAMIRRCALFLCIAFTLWGCRNHNVTYSQDCSPDVNLTQRSAKRGLAFNNLVHPDDFEAIQDGVAWWYTWYWDTEAPENYYEEYQMEFIPMLWGGSPSASVIDGVKQFIMSHPEVEYILVMNEPNLLNQANRTPSQAANDWLVYEQVKSDLAEQGRDIAIVGPAMTWGTMPGYADPLVWLDDFYAEFMSHNGREPIIDYLAFHWYDYGLEAQLDRLQKYGKQIWVTEMANWNRNIDSYEKQIEQMREMVCLCESRSDIFRYAWFYGRSDESDERYTDIFDRNFGELTTLGETYINLPHADN